MLDGYRLLCLVQGDVLDRLFAVRVKPNETVVELRQAILREKPSFLNVNADQIEPYKVRKLLCYGPVHKSDPVEVSCLHDQS
jgi:hypothetical protein